MYIYPKWIHFRGLRSNCPICGAPAHVGQSIRNRQCYWLHDDYLESPFHDNLQKITDAEMDEMINEARMMGIDPKASIGCSCNRKPVICVETGVRYPTIASAAANIGRSSASLSNAIKRKGTCGGFHWEFATVE